METGTKTTLPMRAGNDDQYQHQKHGPEAPPQGVQRAAGRQPNTRILECQIGHRQIRPEHQNKRAEKPRNKPTTADTEGGHRSPSLRGEERQADQSERQGCPDEHHQDDQIDQPEVAPGVAAAPTPKIFEIEGLEPLPAPRVARSGLPIGRRQGAVDPP